MRTLKALLGLALVPVIFPFIAVTCLFPLDPVYQQLRNEFCDALRNDVRAVTGL